MKIQKQGVTITEIPDVEEIQIDRDGDVTIVFNSSVVLIRDPEALAQLIEGLQAALIEARAMSGKEVPKTGLPRVFHAVDQLTPDVTRVRDRDDDIWIRQDDGTWSVEGNTATYVRRQADDLFNFGPLTEILP